MIYRTKTPFNYFSYHRRVFGNMMGGGNLDDDEGSLDSDSDLILDGENDSEDSEDDGNNK